MNEFLFSGLFVHLIFVKNLKCNKKKNTINVMKGNKSLLWM